MRFFTVLLVLLTLLFQSSLFAQTKTVENPGIVKGVIRDSIYNHAIKSATVTIYNNADNKIINYQVSNNLGEFTVQNIPTSTDLKLVISNIGYGQYSKTFAIPESNNFYDFKTVFINVKTNIIDEVVVTIPPIQMNGDTLEFNAAAFKLDSNAVVQDLMRKIPNITQWGDGKITVNGREIKSLLVNGKEFLGGDPKISIENIPKNALEKIQVYNTLEDSKNLQDSSLNMNLKLKKGQDSGYFGKIGAGYGSNKRFETDVSLNIFSPKLQLSLAGASNNVNKVSNDINTLLRNSTYKGVGVQLDYMPNFRTAGINHPNSVGYKFSYDLVDRVAKKENKNIITSEYFLKNNLLEQGNKNKTTTAINKQSNIVEDIINNNSTNKTDQLFNLGYQFSKDRYRLTLSQNINLNHTNSNNNSLNLSSNANNEPVSKSSNSNKNEGTNKSYGFKSGFSYRPNMWDRESRFSGLNFNYAININNNVNNRESITFFESINDPAKTKYFNRTYDNTSGGVTQDINLNIPNLIKLVLGVNKFSLFDIDFNNDVQLKNNSNNNIVYDYNREDDKLINNKYLTNSTKYNSLRYEPEMIFNKSITKRLTNRFDKSWNFSVNIKSQLYYQKNRSEKEVQNMERIYHNILPGASVSFSNNQYGDYRKIFSINYNNTITTPTIYQLAPLIDSINVYYLRLGNLNLKEERKESIQVKYKYLSDRNDNFEYEVSTNYSTLHNDIIDKTQIDQQNTRTIYADNDSDNYQYDLNGTIKKAIKLKNNEIQFRYSTNYNHSKSPTFINATKSFWKNDYINNNVSINYTYKSNLAIEGKQTVVNSFSKESDTENSWKNTNLSTSVSLSYNIVKSLTINSNIALSKNISSGSDVINYNIWNASASYRLLKGNNLELKFSALDILRQNTSIVNYNRGGIITIGSQNVLQQYLMFGLSYYPRKFGK